MDVGTQPVTMPSRRGLLVRICAALLAAAAILVLIVLPAEYNIDPTGIGQVLGLRAIALSAEKSPPAAMAEGGDPAHSYDMSVRSDEIRIPLYEFGELEYKVTMRPGDTMVYSWAVDKGTEVYYDFHGEPPDDPENFQSYGEGTATHANGSLTAPFAGIHGWFFQNQKPKPIVVVLKVSGFYTLHQQPPQ